MSQLDLSPLSVSSIFRYGHAAAALDDRRMVIFGGRGFLGKFLEDTWLFDIALNEWHGPMYGSEIYPSPSPRAFMGAFSAKSSDSIEETKRLYIFGGTDGLENFGDLWMLKAGRYDTKLEDMRWERAVVVGPMPSPRFE